MLSMTAVFVFALTVVAVIIFTWIAKRAKRAHSRPGCRSVSPSREHILMRRYREWVATPNCGTFHEFCFDYSARAARANQAH